MSFILVFHDWRTPFLFVGGVWGLQLGCISLFFACSDHISVHFPGTLTD